MHPRPGSLLSARTFHRPKYATRSSNDQTLLYVPRTRTLTGDKAFQAAGPRLWNSLPINIRQAKTLNIFKNELKTHLFD